MSGVFIDGGGHNQMGHGIQHGIQMDHGGDGFAHHGHDHGSIGPGQGGDGGFVQNLLGFNQHHGQSFLSHLLGLDQPQHHQGGPAQHVPPGQAPSQTAIWNMALGSLKPSNLLQGISISVNVWWLIMFLSFIGWLFVLYFIRHHDPFADAVIGTRAPHTATADFDRRVIDHCRGATPLKTSANGGLGNFYVPVPGGGRQATAAAGSSTYQSSPAMAPTPAYQPMSPYQQPLGSTATAYQGQVQAQVPGSLPVSVSAMEQNPPFSFGVPNGQSGYAAQPVAAPSLPARSLASGLNDAQRLADAQHLAAQHYGSSSRFQSSPEGLPPLPATGFYPPSSTGRPATLAIDSASRVRTIVNR